MDSEGFVNDKAEEAVLAAFLQEPDLSAQSLTLSETDFTTQDRRDLFNAVRNYTAEKGDCTDIVAFSDKLRQMYGERETKLTQYAVNLKLQEIGAKYSLKKHIEILRGATSKRKLYDILGKARQQLENDGEAATVLETTRQSLREMATVSDSWTSIGDVMASTYRVLQKRANGEEPLMPSGIPILDKITTGFHHGELTIIGARPSVGKSAFAMSCAINAAKAGYKVGVVSREMRDDQYGVRLFQSGTDVDSRNMRTGELVYEDWEQLAQAMGYYQGLPMSFLFNTKDIEDLRAEVQQRVDTVGLDMLVVDYAQLMRTKQRFDADYQRIGYVTKTLKDMTIDFNLCIIALAQVGRSSAGDMPSLEELRGSGDMEQDADNVLFLHRPEKATDEWVAPEDVGLFNILQQDGRQYIAVRVAKQRQGEIGSMAMVFNPKRMMYLGIDGTV